MLYLFDKVCLILVCYFQLQSDLVIYAVLTEIKRILLSTFYV